MYAVIRAGGKQYRVAPGDVIRVEKLGDGTGGQVEFPVLAVSSEEGKVAAESGARVVGKVVEQGRGPKLVVFHYKRKKQYKKLRGHRQGYTAVRIVEITSGGQSFKAPALPKIEAKMEAKPKKVREKEVEAETPAAEAKHTKPAAKKKASAPKKAVKTAGKKK